MKEGEKRIKIKLKLKLNKREEQKLEAAKTLSEPN